MSPELKDLLTVSLSGFSIITNMGMFVYLRRIDTRKASEALIKAAETKADERHRQVLKDISALEEKLAPRIGQLERDMERSISHEDLSGLYDKINQCAEQTAGLRGELSEIKNSLHSLVARIFDRGLK